MGLWYSDLVVNTPEGSRPHDTLSMESERCRECISAWSLFQLAPSCVPKVLLKLMCYTSSWWTCATKQSRSDEIRNRRSNLTLRGSLPNQQSAQNLIPRAFLRQYLAPNLKKSLILWRLCQKGDPPWGVAEKMSLAPGYLALMIRCHRVFSGLSVNRRQTHFTIKAMFIILVLIILRPPWFLGWQTSSQFTQCCLHLSPTPSQKNPLLCLSKPSSVPSASRNRLMVCRGMLDKQESMSMCLAAEDKHIYLLYLYKRPPLPYFS
jgi:hypothetical protein